MTFPRGLNSGNILGVVMIFKSHVSLQAGFLRVSNMYSCSFLRIYLMYFSEFTDGIP